MKKVNIFRIYVIAVTKSWRKPVVLEKYQKIIYNLL